MQVTINTDAAELCTDTYAPVHTQVQTRLRLDGAQLASLRYARIT